MPARHRVAIFELDDTEPRDRPDRENLLIRVVPLDEEPLDYLARTDEELVRRVVRVRDDLAPSTVFSRRKRAGSRRHKETVRFRNRGHSVLGHDEAYRVYVIELDPTGIDDIGLGYVYVGETTQPVEDRFEQHRLGEVSWSKARGSRHARGRAIRLRPDLTDVTIYRSRTASKAAERRLADRLREAGYRVEGGR